MGLDSAAAQHRQTWRCIQLIEACIIGDGNYSVTADSGHGKATSALTVRCRRRGVGLYGRSVLEADLLYLRVTLWVTSDLVEAAALDSGN